MKTKILAAALTAACTLAHAAAVGSTDVTPASAAPASAAASGVDPAVAARRAADAAKLSEAFALIRSRRAQAAIDRVLDPLIATQEAENANRTETVYCGSSLTESLYYMAQAANANKPAIALDSTWCTALYMRGYAETDLGKLQAAEADYTRAIALSPSNPHYLSEMGELQSKKRDWNAALSWFHRAETASEFAGPERAQGELGRALRGIGFVDVELGKLDEAEATYRRCLEINANDQKAKAELGYVLNLRAKQAGLGK